MVRNFTSECKQYLLNLVSEEGNEQLGSVSDNFGSMLSTTAQTLGFSSLEGYANTMDGYFTGVVEKNNTTSTDIENIFSNVYLADGTCNNKLLAIKSILDTYKNSLDMLAQAINPSNDSFNLPAMESLARGLNINSIVNETLMVQAGDGLSEDDISSMDPDALQLLMETTIDSYLATHDVKIGDKITIVLAPNVILTYSVKVEGEYDDDGLVDIEATIEAQQGEISSVSGKIPLGDVASVNVNSEGALGLQVNGDGTSGSISVNGDGVSASTSVQTGDVNWTVETGTSGVKVSGSVSDGVNTFTASASTTLYSETIGESVSTQVDNVTVTTSAELTVYNAWQPQEEPVTVTQPATATVPAPITTTTTTGTVTAPQTTTTTTTTTAGDSSYNSGPSSGGWINVDPPSEEAVAVVAVVVVVAIVAIALAPETGGASLGLFALV